MKPAIPIIHCFDHNYVLQAAVCFYSLLEHASPQRTYLIEVVGNGLTDGDKALLVGIVSKFPQAKISFMDSPEIELPALPKDGNISKDVFYKLLAANLFPQYSRVVIADVDVVYQGDIAEVFDALPEDDEAIIAAPLDVTYAAWRGEGILRDIGYPKSLARYERFLTLEERSKLRFGAGFMVHNLKRIREANLDKVWFDYAQKHFSRLILFEQDVLNYVSGHQMKALPGSAMAIAGYYAHYQTLSEADRKSNPAWDEMYKHPIQVHYASGIKPWKYPDSPMADLWFDALLKSGLFPQWLKWIDNYMHGESKKYKRRTLFQCSMPFGKKQRLRFSMIKERSLQ